MVLEQILSELPQLLLKSVEVKSHSSIIFLMYKIRSWNYYGAFISFAHLNRKNNNNDIFKIYLLQ